MVLVPITEPDKAPPPLTRYVADPASFDSRYRDLFVAIPGATGTAHVPKRGTVTWIYHRILVTEPYRWTLSSLLYEIHVVRGRRFDCDIAKRNLRGSALCKTGGWGFHGDSEGRLALIPVESPRYAELVADPHTTVVRPY
jgi:hypothetical protein